MLRPTDSRLRKSWATWHIGCRQRSVLCCRRGKERDTPRCGAIAFFLSSEYVVEGNSTPYRLSTRQRDHANGKGSGFL